MDASIPSRPAATTDGLVPFFALACGLTWILSLPLAVALAARQEPAPLVLLGAGLSAWGPTIAAAVVARPRGELRDVFGRWRVAPLWIALALFLPMAVHLVANVVEVVLGGSPASWFYPPDEPERIAALVMFSLGEEFGWRGFASPRMSARFGPVAGPLLLGVVWASWHATMLVDPATGSFDPSQAVLLAAMLPLWSVVYAWLLARTGRSMAVAIALHAGGHLDNIGFAPPGDVRVQVVYVGLVGVLAALAGWSLTKRAA